MTANIISKQCCKCKQVFPLTYFWKARYRKDGLQSTCKTCQRDYAKKYAQTENGEVILRNRNIRYRQTPKGKNSNNARSQRYKHRNPLKTKARSAVAHAVRAGKLPHPTILNCTCGHFAQEYHHHKGYAPEHHLDVVPICVSCHTD